MIDIMPPLVEQKEKNETETDSQYHFFAEFIIDIRAKDDAEILNFNYISISGDMYSEMYYSESVSEATPEDLLTTTMTGHLDCELEPGVYRLVVGGACDGGKTWTDCGYEYDVWVNYDFISQYKLTDEEVKVYWGEWCNVDDVDKFE